jgi:hypothetical protein
MEFVTRFVLSIVIGVFIPTLRPFLAGSEANAAVCARGVYRAGCAGAGGAVVLRRQSVAACRTVIINGVVVRRCI